ncbi:DUF2497 domain-containing protein [Pacificimonas sp. WHA3]|uniref:DUF2497 domain-containing protein n=1 Tax=Pacificimonas pallii TaxID=2827236 RepID=A0ABS6SFL1_9SPHN|nr:DUF2497 domain-containing protein [Pacificimonas pallii]MBV7257202.1 DUF2497 domain-containing protein [Pacificimonas pallii]
MSPPPRSDQSVDDILASIRTLIADGGEVDERREPGTVAEAMASRDTPGTAEDVHADLQRLAEAARAPASDSAASAAPVTAATLETTLMRGYAGSDNTLEGVVRDMLRPMLQEWLDAHLPDLVERMVAEQIHHITKR